MPLHISLKQYQPDRGLNWSKHAFVLMTLHSFLLPRLGIISYFIFIFIIFFPGCFLSRVVVRVSQAV